MFRRDPFKFEKRSQLSSVRTTKRFPSPQCASAIQIVRPLESIAETQPQLQPALLRLSATISQYFTRRMRFWLPNCSLHLRQPCHCYRVALDRIWPDFSRPIADRLSVTKSNFVISFIPSPSTCESVRVLIVGDVSGLAESVRVSQNRRDLSGRHPWSNL
jgi:hypothetical protein